MKFLDLFAGIGGFRKGMEAAGHECVGFCEWDRFARASYISMHLLTDEQRTELAAMDFKKRQKEILKNEKYLNGEWMATDIRNVNGGNVPKADIWCFGAPCFVAGTLITTHRGMIPIEEVETGDMVLTHKCRFKKVLATMKSRKKGVYTISVKGNRDTSCTGNHRFYVRYHRHYLETDTWDYSEPEWKRIDKFNGSEEIQFPTAVGALWAEYDSITIEPHRIETVYNLEVEDDNSYTANNMGVHNCQDFSIAGQRQGLDGDRSSLVREVFRIVGEIREGDRPEWLVYENVKGMLTTNGGRDYLAILLEMDGLGFDCQWQVFNSKDYGVPQNRERVYTIGHLRAKGRKKIFPIEAADGNDNFQVGVNQIGRYTYGGNQVSNPMPFRVYDPDGIGPCLNQMSGGGTEPLTAIKVIGKADEKRHSQADIMAIDGICQTIDTLKERKKIAVPIGVVDPQGRQGKKLEPDGLAP